MKQELFLNYKKAPPGVYVRGVFAGSGIVRDPLSRIPLPYNYLSILRGIAPKSRMILH